ncbi:MAG: MerR family DNA-binding transcriptional regulator, partial [Acidimicrobiaceae bacterium]|nr:MerR family DNA-binding transcriptional regulator [Acidimicrobiaceae bacterium]
MEERSHLAIGEVLTLLREEFPDVTISKIRFLESQGLVDPERTPSGYRKFYDGDVARLRWILLQQKENFLPLKVIKDRLGELDTAGSEPAAAGSGKAAASAKTGMGPGAGSENGAAPEDAPQADAPDATSAPASPPTLRAVPDEGADLARAAVGSAVAGSPGDRRAPEAGHAPDA